MRNSKKLLKKLCRKVKEILPKRVRLNDVEIWFQDEARVGQKGTTTRLWAIKGTRPRAIRQEQYEYATFLEQFAQQEI